MQDVGSEGEGCVKEDLDILDMDSRESIDGCCDEIPTDGYHGEIPIYGCLRVDVATNGYQYSMETSTDGCSYIYVGDIEIHIEDIVASTHYFNHRDLEAEEKCPDRLPLHLFSFMRLIMQMRRRRFTLMSLPT